MTALIQIEDLHFGPVSHGLDSPKILRGIDLAIDEGAFVAIIGENGSGKTTLIKHINGLLVPSSGRVLVDGLDTRQPENRIRLQSMVGMVFQNPADQIVASTVEEDIAFGLENFNLPTSEIRDRVKEQLIVSGLLNEAARPPHLLSGGQVQMVALAGVLARQPRVILFDEPTTMLDPQSRRSFLQRLLHLRQEGMTIVYVTHHMEETLGADQVVVLQAGRIAFFGSPEKIFTERTNLYEAGLEKPDIFKLSDEFTSIGWQLPVINMTMDALMDALPAYSGPITIKPTFFSDARTSNLNEKPLIHLENVHYTYLSGSPLAQKALVGSDIDIYPANIHAIAGANGSGKSTLLQHINGILRPEMGHVHVGQFILDDPQMALRDVVKKVGLVFQNPETQFFEIFVGDEIAYGPKQFEMLEVRNRVQKAMDMVGLDFEAFKDRRLETLSGGEKRKVALASTLVLDQDIIMFDEPTAGMDPRSRDTFIDLIKVLKAQGKTIMIASHRMEELAEISDYVSLMRSGQVFQSGACGNIMSNSKAISEVGLVPPLAVIVTQALVDKGWPINIEDNYTVDRLISSLKDCLA